MDASLGRVPAGHYDGASAGEIAARCHLPGVRLFAEIGSTMDVAHELAAEGAAAGTLVIAEQQVHGRGRGGHGWVSAPGGTIAMSLIERPTDPVAIGVLSLRLGLQAVQALSPLATELRVKWPNDLMRSRAKVGGILVEARWRGATPDWVVIGLGLNVREGPWPGSASLDFAGSRVDILEVLLPAFRAAAAASGGLTEAERSDWRRRDWAAGRAVVMPARGVVRGVDEDGSLVVDGAAGPIRCMSGSLVLAEESGDATRI